MKYDIATAIKDSDKEDHILLSGMTIIVAYTVIIWFEKHKQVKLLIWDKGRKNMKAGYRPVTFTSFDLAELLIAIK